MSRLIFSRPEGQRWLFGLAILIQVLLCALSKESIYFWDSIQFGSRHATHFYQGGSIFLPEAINSGNPPLLGLMVSVAWNLFGRELWVSHVVLWPFLFINLTILAALGRKLLPNSWGWLPLLWMAVPVYAAQTTLVSPDILLVTGMLSVIYGWYTNHRIAIFLGSLLLGFVSLRGFIVLLGFSAWWLFRSHNRKLVLYLVPGILGALFYYAAHYINMGWAMIPAQSPWAGGFDLEGPMAWLRKTLILGWRLMDFGLIFLWLGLFIAVRIKGKKVHSKAEWQLLAIWVILFSMLAIGFSALNMHRYLLPVFFAGTLLFFMYSENTPRLRWVVFVGLITGNLWVYPDRIAQGWDATLAWLPWSKHREHVLENMNRQGIEPSTTATAFPNLGPMDELDLSGSSVRFLPKENIQSAAYFFYSNVFNDLSDKDLEYISSWPIVFQSGTWPVKVILYKNPDYNGT